MKTKNLSSIKALTAAFIFSSLFACTSKNPEQNKSTSTPVNKIDTIAKQQRSEPTMHAEMKFVNYNDDGDYYQFIAQQGDSTHYFINNDDSARNLNRGDMVDVMWKHGTITMAGDDEKPAPAEILITAKKTSDGPVTKFRKTYNKKLKYTWSPDEEYSEDYLDKIYKLVEHYLANTKNELLKNAVAKRTNITYSIESTERNNRNYTLIGIAPVGENGANIVEWLYIDTENHNLYLFNDAEDQLEEFK